mmetsp:Transcript_22421/g.36126  ORF Transcript_22421/g.36126 Transcript_22421/m.36126 type:complete len:144 (-) Transcript_22421:5095-5526(-)
MQHKEAHSIATTLLQRTRLGMFGGDYDTWMASFALPQQVQTFEGERVLRTPEDLNEVYHTLSAHFVHRGVTDIARHVIAAEFRGEDAIHSTHETRLMQGDLLMGAPFVAYSVLRKAKAGWQVAESTYAIADNVAHSRLLAGRL